MTRVLRARVQPNGEMYMADFDKALHDAGGQPATQPPAPPPQVAPSQAEPVIRNCLGAVHGVTEPTDAGKSEDEAAKESPGKSTDARAVLLQRINDLKENNASNDRCYTSPLATASCNCD